MQLVGRLRRWDHFSSVPPSGIFPPIDLRPRDVSSPASLLLLLLTLLLLPLLLPRPNVAHGRQIRMAIQRALLILVLRVYPAVAWRQGAPRNGSVMC